MPTAVGEPLEEVELEPETLTGLGGAANQLRHPVPLAAAPNLVQAVLAAEDHRFFQHPGVDVRAVARAVWVNIRRGGLAQGGSTLTQQLVKNLVLTPKRTWGRKCARRARPRARAALLEGRDPLGLPERHLPRPARRLRRLRRRRSGAELFGKDVERLTLGEAATLAGIIPAPNTYSPVQHPERARERRNAILRRMKDLRMLDDKRVAQASQERLVVQRGTVITPRALLRRLGARPGRAAPAGRRGLVGRPAHLHDAQPRPPAGRRGRAGARLDRLEGQYRALRRTDPAGRLQGAIVALDPRTGEIRAMVGGRDYGQSQFNRVVRAGGSPARPSSRSCTWRRWATGHGASRPTLPRHRSWRIGRSRSGPAAPPGRRATTRTGTRARSRCGGRSSSRSTPRQCGWRRASGTTRSSVPRGRPGSPAPWSPSPPSSSGASR